MSSAEPLARRADNSECRECRGGLAHCHGTLIHHALRRSECTDDDCRTPDVMHVFSIDCAAIGCSCAAAVALAM